MKPKIITGCINFKRKTNKNGIYFLKKSTLLPKYSIKTKLINGDLLILVDEYGDVVNTFSTQNKIVIELNYKFVKELPFIDTEILYANNCENIKISKHTKIIPLKMSFMDLIFSLRKPKNEEKKYTSYDEIQKLCPGISKKEYVQIYY